MEKRIEKFLEFDGKVIPFLSVDGLWYVAVKPICDVLGVDYEQQRRNIKDDEILSGVIVKQQMHDSNDRLRDMVCLPEKYVYGWLFSIRSDSAELTVYKRKCYDILYEHFHGTITQRAKALRIRNEAQTEIEVLKAELSNNDTYSKMLNAKSTLYYANKELQQLDSKLVDSQMNIFEAPHE